MSPIFANRLYEPLKRAGERFVPISSDRAIGEIFAKLQYLLVNHGPRCLACMRGNMEVTLDMGLIRVWIRETGFSDAFGQS